MLRTIQWLGYCLIALGMLLYAATFVMAYLRGGVMAVIDRWFAHPIGETALLLLCVGPGMLFLGWAGRRRERSIEQRKTLSVDGARTVRAAVTSGDLVAFRTLITQLPNLNERLTPENWTLLHFLAAQGENTKPVHAIMTDDLLKAGADVNCRTDWVGRRFTSSRCKVNDRRANWPEY
jgi:hypothetical protein